MGFLLGIEIFKELWAEFFLLASGEKTKLNPFFRGEGVYDEASLIDRSNGGTGVLMSKEALDDLGDTLSYIS